MDKPEYIKEEHGYEGGYASGYNAALVKFEAYHNHVIEGVNEAVKYVLNIYLPHNFNTDNFKGEVAHAISKRLEEIGDG